MYNRMCVKVHFASISTVFFIFQRTVHPRVLCFRELLTPVLYFRELFNPGFIFQTTDHPRDLYFRELFTLMFYISENCSPPVFIFQRTVYTRVYISENCSPPGFIFQRTVHPWFVYFRELFTPGFYISKNCSPLGFSGVRVAHYLLFCVMFCQPTFFLNMVIVLSDLLPITVFDDHFWYLQTFPKYCT